MGNRFLKGGKLQQKNRKSELPFKDFEAHATIVIGTFPEAGLVLDGIQAAVLVTAPIPLAILVVD